MMSQLSDDSQRRQLLDTGKFPTDPANYPEETNSSESDGGASDNSRSSERSKKRMENNERSKKRVEEENSLASILKKFSILRFYSTSNFSHKSTIFQQSNRGYQSPPEPTETTADGNQVPLKLINFKF